MMFFQFIIPLSLGWALATTSLAFADQSDAARQPETQQPEAQHEVLLTVKRGLNAELTFSHAAPGLRAIPDQSPDAEVLVRLERSAAPRAPDAATHEYTLSFFGTVAGEYDLSQWVVHRDGSALASEDALPPQWVRVVSELPPEQGTSLYEIADPQVSAPRGYRALMITLCLAWASVPVVWGFLRWQARRPEPEPIIVAAPTLADRLRPLVQRASEGQLTVAEQGRLELLLYVFWQRRLGLPESLAEALPILRRDAEAGPLLRTLEAWVHADASVRPELTATTLDALLEPYHATAAESLDALQNFEATESKAHVESGATV